MLPRRALAAIATTAMALALLLNFKTQSAPIGPTSVVVGQPATGSTVGASGQSSSASTPPVAGSSGSSAASTPPSASSGSATSGSAGSGSPSTGQSASGSTLKSGTFTGSTIQIPFGNVQVQVVVKGGRITDVQPLQMPTAHARSQMISQYVAPMLRQEVLQAQNAQINLVSGATYTSEAYAQSLQAALDQAVA
jgi:uncharacterized protein with FMN-binding domain